MHTAGLFRINQLSVAGHNQRFAVSAGVCEQEPVLLVTPNILHSRPSAILNALVPARFQK